MFGFSIYVGINIIVTPQTWTTGTSMPTARTEVAGSVLDGKIYVVGGYDESGKTTDVVEVYDPKQILE